MRDANACLDCGMKSRTVAPGRMNGAIGATVTGPRDTLRPVHFAEGEAACVVEIQLLFLRRQVRVNSLPELQCGHERRVAQARVAPADQSKACIREEARLPREDDEAATVALEVLIEGSEHR